MNTQLQSLFQTAAEHASSALSKLLAQPVHVETVEVVTTKPEVLTQQLGITDELVVTSIVQITKDLNGMVIFLIPVSGLQTLIQQSIDIHNPEQAKPHISQMTEITNIFAGTLLKDISEKRTLSLLQSIPDNAIDMRKATLDELCSQLALSSPSLLAVSIALSISIDMIRANLIILFDETSAASLNTSTS